MFTWGPPLINTKEREQANSLYGQSIYKLECTPVKYLEIPKEYFLEGHKFREDTGKSFQKEKSLYKYR